MAKKQSLKDSINASFDELDRILQERKKLLLAECSRIDPAQVELNFALDMSKVANNCGRFEVKELNIPGAKGIAKDSNGDIYITSCTLNCVYVYSQTADQQIRIIRGTSRATSECHEDDGEATNKCYERNSQVVLFKEPHGIDISNGIIYVAELGGNRIRAFTPAGTLKCTYGNPLEGHEDIHCGELKFSCPHDVKIGPNERVYVADRGSDSIQVFKKDGSHDNEHDKKCELLSMRIAHPEGIAFHGESCYVTGYGSNAFTVLNHHDMVQQYISPKMGNIKPKGIAVDDASGYALITVVVSRDDLDKEHGALQVYNQNKQLVKTIAHSNCFKNPFGILITDNGASIWVADQDANKVFRLNKSCIFN